MSLSRVSSLNPVRLLLLAVGTVLARLGLVSSERTRRTVELSWPRIVTGLARMSKNAADVAMVGIGVGPAAIAGVGYAGAYWGVTFAIGGGLAAGTIALVSQRFGADARDDLGQAVRSSAALVVAVAVSLVQASALAVIPQGVTSAVAGALDASGDTRVPFYGRALGMFGFAIPLTYLGATTPLGLAGIYLAFFGETVVPAAVNYYRFRTGTWKRVSRAYRPGASPSDD